MITHNRLTRIFFLGILASLFWILAACSANNAVLEPQKTDLPENEIAIPIVGSEKGSEAQSENLTTVTTYPDTETANATAEITQSDAYPSPTEKPISNDDPIMEPKPTSRGHDLVATDPSTVALASGKVQLVEFFAFW